MSVAPHSPAPRLAVAGPAPSLEGLEGALLSVRISTEPRRLEKLLDMLARLDFPISPQIYHQAALLCLYADGRQHYQPTTTVEFPAYARWLPAIREALARGGFDPAWLVARNMLADLAADFDVQPAPPGAPYQTVIWYRHGNRSPRPAE